MTKTQAGPHAAVLALLNEAFNRRSWHGTNLRGSIRGMSTEQAAWRPGPGRHCVAEIVVHTAYWKYAVRRRLTGEKRGSFPLAGSNWIELPEMPTESQWRQYVRLLEGEHRALCAAVAALPPGELAATRPGSKVGNAAVLRGIALHDVYHAGQIQTLKALWKARRR